jgi:hypothetical protein
MANSFAKPTVVWLDDADRAKLMEIAQRIEAPSERVGGRMLAKALRDLSLGEVEPPREPTKTTTRAGKRGVRYCLPRA